MSFWSTLTGAAAAQAGIPSSVVPDLSAALTVPDQVGIKTPWRTGAPQLTPILYSDIYGDVPRSLAMSRDVAMGVPALARARHILCGTVAACAIQVWRGDTVRAKQPRWTYTSEAGLPAFHRMLWTVDDQLWHGWSLWDVERRDGPDSPLVDDSTPRRVPAHRWEFERETGAVKVDGEPFPADRALLLPGPHEGLLRFARVAITQAAELEASATRVAQNPAAYLNLHYEGDAPMDETAIDALIERWSAARRGENGGVAYTGAGVTASEMGAAAEHLLVEGRNAAAVNMARVASMPAAMVDASNAGASLTYETTAGRNAELLDYGLNLYMDALSARLSLDDVVPAGDSVRFDTTQLRAAQPSPTGPTTQD
jgi:hypothetical protein